MRQSEKLNTKEKQNEQLTKSKYECDVYLLERNNKIL